jgi:fluoroquinolone transport system permease protein
VKRIQALSRLDAVLAWRRGVIGAAIAVVVMYVILLRLLPEDIASAVLPYLVFSDPAALGFFFVGGIVLADRSDGVAAAVLVTPVEPVQVLVARVGTLSALGALGGIAIGLASGAAVRWASFLPGVLLTALFYTSFGYAVAVRARSVNEYFARATAWAIPLFAPLVFMATGAESWLLALWPTTAAIVLLTGTTGVVGLLATSTLAVATALVGRWALRELEAARREGRA